MKKSTAIKLLGVFILILISVSVSTAQIVVKGTLSSVDYESSIAIGSVSQVIGATPAQQEAIGSQISFALYVNSGLDENPVQVGNTYEATCMVSRGGTIIVVEVSCRLIGGGIKRWRTPVTR